MVIATLTPITHFISSTFMLAMSSLTLESLPSVPIALFIFFALFMFV
jgi:hypothetical protein